MSPSVLTGMNRETMLEVYEEGRRAEMCGGDEEEGEVPVGREGSG